MRGLVTVPPARKGHREAHARGAWTALAYGAVGAAGFCLAEVSGRSALTTEPWVGRGGAAALVTSLVLGGLFAAATVRTTRALGRAGWARALHADLRPFVHGMGDAEIGVVALASGVGEELFFRGWLTPAVGVLLSSVAFGVLHQVRGRAGWTWALWATITGLLLAAIYELTGHLAGPILAHVTINLVNLRYLRDHDPHGKPRALGGLLAR